MYPCLVFSLFLLCFSVWNVCTRFFSKHTFVIIRSFFFLPGIFFGFVCLICEYKKRKEKKNVKIQNKKQTTKLWWQLLKRAIFLITTKNNNKKKNPKEKTNSLTRYLNFFIFKNSKSFALSVLDHIFFSSQLSLKPLI